MLDKFASYKEFDTQELRDSLLKIKDKLFYQISQNIFRTGTNDFISDYVRLLVVNEYINPFDGNILNQIINKSEELEMNYKGYYFDGEKKNIIKLDNGNYIFFHFGKYKSNLNIIISNLDKNFEGMFEKNDKLTKQLNLDFTGSIDYLYGRYFKSKKGSNMFDITGDKHHILIRIDWGGAFNDSDGLNTIPKEVLYYRRARSNGGGAGYDYLILPKDYKARYTIDNF